MLSFNAAAQKVTSCDCEGFVDLDYKYSVFLFNKPNGSLSKSLKHDFKNEDYLTFEIDKTSGNFFHVKIQYAINGKSYQGWVKKAKYLATFIKNYDSTVLLYLKPNVTSVKILQESSSSVQIADCKDNWIYIKSKSTASIKFEGWLQSKDQCANPYTTCN